MIVGVPKEVKVREGRVAIVPGGVKVLSQAGHKVLLQKSAGLGEGIGDEAYLRAGAEIVSTAEEVWQRSEMIMKVKEPIAQEYPLMRPGQILYTFLHLAAVPDLAHALMERGVRAIGYETIELADGSLPLLKPMSEVAGRAAVQVGARCLEKHSGGKGLLLGGVPGVHRGRVVIIGAGAVGINAAKIAIGLGAELTILDINQNRLEYLDDIFGSRISTLMSNPENIAKTIPRADLLIGGVLVTGAKAPCLVSRQLVKMMEPGSAIVDVAIDQGGSIETIRPTTHDEPTYEEEGVIHYGVTNIPGSVPQTSTYALTNVTLSYALELAGKGLQRALRENPALRKGLNVFDGSITYEAVASALSLQFKRYAA